MKLRKVLKNTWRLGLAVNLLVLAILWGSVSGQPRDIVLAIAVAVAVLVAMRRMFHNALVDESTMVFARNSSLPESRKHIADVIGRSQKTLQIVSGHFAAKIWDDDLCSSALDSAIQRGVVCQALSLAPDVESTRIKEQAKRAKNFMLYVPAGSTPLHHNHFVLADGLHIRCEVDDHGGKPIDSAPPDDETRRAYIRYNCVYLGRRASEEFTSLINSAQQLA